MTKQVEISPMAPASVIQALGAMAQFYVTNNTKKRLVPAII